MSAQAPRRAGKEAPEAGLALRFARPLLAALAVGAITALDVVSGPEIRARSLYLLPVLYAAWSDGAAPGAIVGLFGCGAWLFTDLFMQGGRYDVLAPSLLDAAVFALATLGAAFMADRARGAAARSRARARRRGRQMSIASHEVGNALTVLEGASLLLRETAADARSGEWLSMLDRAVTRVRSVDQRLLRRVPARPQPRRRPVRS